MSNTDLIDVAIWRELGEGVTDEETRRRALATPHGAFADGRDEGVAVALVRTDIPPDNDGAHSFDP